MTQGNALPNVSRRLILLLAAVLFPDLSHGATTHPAAGLEPYAVRMLRGPGINGTFHDSGAGIYLGNGLILTAAHVAGKPTAESSLLAGFPFGNVLAVFVKAGEFDDVDATLVSVDATEFPVDMQGLKPLTLCADAPVPGQAVIVVAPGSISESHIISNDVLNGLLAPEVAEKLSTLIADVYTTGNSGTGVFDKATHCLMGIMSRKIERVRTSYAELIPKKSVAPVAKYFVSANLIRSFFGPLLREPTPLRLRAQSRDDMR